MKTYRSRRTRRAPKTLAATAITLTAAIVITVLWPPPAIPAPPAWTAAAPAPRPIPTTNITPAPNTLTFPERGLTIKVIDAADVPTDPQILGRLTWSNPITASSGVTILTSHIQTRTQQGILRRILDIQPGETILTTDENGKTQLWVATALNEYLKSNLPRLRRLDGDRTLHIVTCTGHIRPDGHYSHNLVITFAPARPHKALQPQQP